MRRLIAILALLALATGADAFPGASLVDGKLGEAMLGHPTAAFRGYAFGKDGKPEEIPLQVDERTDNDRWALDHGVKVGGDERPGIFDPNDAIVILNRDLGVRGKVSALPAGAASWLEVRVGSEASPLGHAYVGVFPAAKAPQPSEHVRYDSKTDQVFADKYALKFDTVLPNHVAFVDEIGELGESFVSATHAVGEAYLLGGMFHFARSEADMKEEVEGHRIGAVRAIRRGQYVVPLPLGFHASGRVEFLFYADFLEITGRLRLKYPAWVAGADGGLSGFVEIPPSIAARPIWDPTMIKSSAVPVAVPNPSGESYAALVFDDGDVLVMAVRLEGGLRKMDQRFYFESREGQKNRVFGFEVSEASRLEAGIHPFTLVAAFLHGPTETEILETAKILASPPSVAVQKLALAD